MVDIGKNYVGFPEARRILESPESNNSTRKKEENISPELLKQALEENGVNLASDNILIVYDKDGPLENPEVSTAETHPGVEEVVGSLEAQNGFVPAVVSGWDVDTLRRRRHEYLNEDFRLAGSMGTVVEENGEKKQVRQDIDKDEIYSAFQNLYEAAAEYGEGRSGMKILPQSNSSNIVASLKFEAENDRTGVGEISEETTTEDIYRVLVDESREEFDIIEEQEKKKVIFDNSRENAALLTDVLTEEFTFPGIRFEDREKGIAFYRDNEDDYNIEKQQGYDLVDEAAPENLSVQFNDDWGADIINDVEADFGKPQGVARIGQKAFKDGYNGLMIGDSVSDVEVAEEMEEIIFVAVENSFAHEHVENELNWEYGTDYLVSNNAVDFTEALSNVMRDSREEWTHEIDEGYDSRAYEVAT